MENQRFEKKLMECQGLLSNHQPRENSGKSLKAMALGAKKLGQEGSQGKEDQGETQWRREEEGAAHSENQWQEENRRPARGWGNRRPVEGKRVQH